MKLNRLTARIAALTLGVASAAILVDGGAAIAAPQIGEMTVTPSTSTTTDLFPEFDTNAACPAGSTNMIVSLFGAGLPVDGDPIMGNTALGILTTNAQGGKHAVAGTSLKTFFQSNGILAPTGQYEVRATCQTVSGSTLYGDFVGLMTFTPTGPTDSSYTSALPAVVTSTSLAPVSSPVVYGSSVTFNATVAPAAAAGTVQFKDGSTSLGAPQPVSGGTSSYTTTLLDAGAHSITATFIPTSAAVYQGSVSASRSLTVTKANTSVTVTTNGPSEEFAPAVFTAAVSAGVPGTVQFKVDGSNVGSPATVSSGSASYSTTALAPGAYQVSAVFTPTNLTNYNSATSTDVAHNVTAYSGVTESETIRATVQAGALLITVVGDKIVDLSTPTINAAGDFLVATGPIDPLQVTDTRAGDPGWNVNGVVTDFVNGLSSVSKFNLGWDPNVVSLAANQAGAFVSGPTVVAGSQPTAAGVPGPGIGLGAPRSLGTAPNDSGNGTAVLGADLTLQIPTDVPAGLYVATLTFTAI